LRTLHSFLLILVVCSSTTSCTETFDAPDVLYDACSPIVVVAGPEASDAERQAVVDGVTLWNQRGVTALTTHDVPGAPRITVTFQDAAPAFHGYYDGDTGQVYVNRALPDAHARAVTVAHELGHAVGLPHISERESVMQKANLVVEPNADDGIAVLAFWGGCAP
jgi:hypothetical protein